MISLKLILAILLGKTILTINRLTGSGGTAAPGLIALKICPDMVRRLGSQLDKNILITGTNGKTTTARMVSSILKQANINHFHNRVGSNLLRGVASTLLKNSSISGKMPKGFLGLWETDEAAFPIISEQTKPIAVLITNLFRDQLDRYGEINTLADKWKKALLKLPSDTIVLLNADDATVAGLGKNLKTKVLYFGLSNPQLSSKKPDHASDAANCPDCMSELAFSKCYLGHMGTYSCPKCGPIQPKKNFSLIKSTHQIVQIKIPKKTISFKNSLPGDYNLYNFTAAASLASLLSIEESAITHALSNFKSAFGRVEKIKAGEKTLNIFLVKNPTGFNEVIETLIKNKKKITPLIVINDLIADGTDVSWLWDVNFEKLAPYLKKSIVSGTRAYDMALRLKYSRAARSQQPATRKKIPDNWQLEAGNLIIQSNLKKAIEQLLKSNDQNTYILPTYTAMLQTRKILNQMGLVHSSWKD